MKKVILLLVCSIFCFHTSQAQIMRKLKEKVNNTIDKTIDKKIDNIGKKSEKDTPAQDDKKTGSQQVNSVNEPAPSGTAPFKVYSKFDFVPGREIVYFDNFEKDRIGETPEGWLTTNAAEVVEIDGLPGKWITLNQKGAAANIIRNKKQSWGDNFTVEFDILRDPSFNKGGDIYIILGNSAGRLVTEEANLKDLLGRENLGFDFRFSNGMVSNFHASRGMGSGFVNGTKFLDEQGLKAGFSQPQHISIAVNGKRMRFWWNEKKMVDVHSAVVSDAIPNLLGFTAHYNTNVLYYISNIRIARDVPDNVEEGKKGKVVSNLLFDFGTANLRPESLGSVYDVSKVIKEASGPVKIVGHTDSDGTADVNIKLSRDRAEAVKNILVKDYGIDKSKLTTDGRGASQPIADNTSAEGRAQNRRVEFIFKPEADNYQATAASGLNRAPANLTLQSKILNTTLPFTQIMKGPKDTYVLTASMEEGDAKENFLKIILKPVAGKLTPGTYLFKVQNEKNPSYGTKELPQIEKSDAVLYFGNGKKPYIAGFVPYISTQHESKYYNGTNFNPPAMADNCKLVIESVNNGRASGYFILGVRSDGNNAVEVGDAMTRTITGKYEGEMKGTFKDIPVY